MISTYYGYREWIMVHRSLWDRILESRLLAPQIIFYPSWYSYIVWWKKKVKPFPPNWYRYVWYKTVRVREMFVEEGFSNVFEWGFIIMFFLFFFKQRICSTTPLENSISLQQQPYDFLKVNKYTQRQPRKNQQRQQQQQNMYDAKTLEKTPDV